MKSRWLVGLIVAVFVLSLAPPARAASGDKIVRTKSLTGLPVINTVCALLGCVNLGALDTPPGSTAPSSLFLVRGLVDNTVNWLLSLLGLAAIEPDLEVGISESGWGNDQATAAVLDQATASVLDQLWDRTPMTYYGSTAWQSYLTQPAADIIRLRDAHCDLRATGAGLVAVIDTGIDLDHPTLKPSLVPGVDFAGGTGNGDEKNGVTQATAAVLDGTNWVNGGTVAGVDQATAAVLDDDPSQAAFGHGTMVAGVVHLVSPKAKIMSVRAFRSDGKANTSDILRAIYYSVNKGAKVLNMSFSRPTPSLEMKIALDYAALRGVIAVASMGNEGTTQPRYPAAYDNVIGVAATTNQDVRSSFSNYGSKTTLAAPGNWIITTYPFSTFAATSGTSFSTPMVAGAASLLVGIQGNASPSQVEWAVTHAKALATEQVGAGRLDLFQAISAGRALWPWGASSAVPASCGADDVDWTEAP